MTGASSNGIDVQIDLRGFWFGVRDQGGRSACLACATSDAHAHSHGLHHPLSAEFLFYHAGQFMPGRDVSDGLTFSAVGTALRAEGQPHENEWPYKPLHPLPWIPPPVTQLWYGSMSSAAGAEQRILDALQSRQPVVLGVRLTIGLIDGLAPYIIPSDGPAFGSHAVLAVGWARHVSAGSLLLIRNSWGQSWADQGHAWLPTAYLKDKLIGYGIVSPKL